MSTFPNFNAAISSCFFLYSLSYRIRLAHLEKHQFPEVQPELPLLLYSLSEIKYVRFHLILLETLLQMLLQQMKLEQNELDSPFF